MKDKSVSVIARIVFALAIGYFGTNHLMHADMMTGGVPAFLPQPIIWVYITGAALTLAAIAFIIGVKIRLAGYLLGLLLLIIVLTIHLPGVLKAADVNAQMYSMTMIVKDLGLSAAAFYIGSKH